MTGISPSDRPREKLERAGARALGDNELVAIVIGHGTAGAGALEVANRVLTASDGVNGLRRIDRAELARVPGVGAAIAGRLAAAVELGRRTLLHAPDPRQRFSTSLEVGRFLLPQFGASPVEQFGVMLLDARHRLIRAQLVASGSVDAVAVHPREVFRAAIVAGASSLVAFHNHPTGDVTPSPADLLLTRRLLRAGDLVGIDVLDHLILGDTRYCSVREAGLFEWRG